MCFLPNTLPLSGEESTRLVVAAIQNWCSKRERELEREMHLYFSFPFEFHKFCKTWQLHVILQTPFYMCSECVQHSYSPKNFFKVIFLVIFP